MAPPLVQVYVIVLSSVFGSIALIALGVGVSCWLSAAALPGYMSKAVRMIATGGPILGAATLVVACFLNGVAVLLKLDPDLPQLGLPLATREASTEELSMGCTFGRAPPT